MEWRHAGAAMVGSCCGTTAITTAAMAEALDI
ncbi:homocysteine S-methyltransferase family protein [Collinsella aerofaciens]